MKKFTEMNRKGFTLIEVIVVAAIIAILAGILVPMIFGQIDESKKTRALGDCTSVKNAVTAFLGTTKKLPIYYNEADCAAIGSFAYSNRGIDINSADWPYGLSDNTYLFFINIKANHACYNNPAAINLLTDVPPDPWGNRYSSNFADFATPGAPVWVISAGPDGIMQTKAIDTVLSGDDIGIRLQ